MATIPIRKLSDGATKFYPLGVGESTVTTHSITVGENIGKFKKGEVIPAVTTLDTIITKLLTGTGSGHVTLDNKTINTNDEGELQVNIDNDTLVYDETQQKLKVSGSGFAKLDATQEFTGTNTFKKSIKIAESVLPSADRTVVDAHRFSRFKTSVTNVNDLMELPDEGEIPSGTYQLSANRNHGIKIAEGADVELYINDGIVVETTIDDGIYIQNNAVLRLYNSGTIRCLATTGNYCTIYNEGTAYITGGSYERSDGSYNSYYYSILNHGKLLELWDVTAVKNYSKSNASLFVTGYYNYEVGSGRNYINSDKGSRTPKTIIHSGTFFNENPTGTIKNDGGGTVIIYDGNFDGVGHDILQNTGLKAEIHGGNWVKSSIQTNSLIYSGLEHQVPSVGIECKLTITGGSFTFNGDKWLELVFKQSDVVMPRISGGVFGPTTSFTINDVIDTDFDKLVDTGCIAIKKANNICVYYIADMIQYFNGIKFADGDILSTNDGIYIRNVKDVNDETSAVSKRYVDKKVSEASGFNEDTYLETHNEYTAFEVHPTKNIIAAGAIDPITNLAYAVTVPACSAQVIQIRTMNLKDEQNVKIEWGDGATTVIRTADAITKEQVGKKEGVFYDEMTSEKETMAYCSHLYNAEGRYIVKIWGNTYWGVRNDYPTYNLISRIFDSDLPINPCVVDFCNIANGTIRLQKIQVPKYYEGIRNIQNTTNMFQNCYNLISATGFKRFIFSNTPYAPNSMFNGCSNLETCDVRLSQSSVEYASANGNFYKGCAKLTTDLVNLLPSSGFQGRIVSMNSVFNGCTSLTCSDWTTVGNILWDDTTKIWKNTSACFAGCSEAFRENIPEEWGGTRRKPFKGRTFIINGTDDVYSVVQESCDALKMTRTITKDDELYSAVRDLLTELKITHSLKNDDELLDAVKLILLELGAKEVIINN